MFRRLLLTQLLTLIVPQAFAQVTSVPTTIHTPYGNVTHTNYVPAPRYYYGSYGKEKISHKYLFTVVLKKNDSTFTVKARIDHASNNHYIIVKAGKRNDKIVPSDTKMIYRIDFQGTRLYGLPADSCWLFKSQPGKINSYSFLAEKGMDYVIAIQNGDEGSIVPLTKENLLEMVGDNSWTLKLIDQGRLVKAVQTFNKTSR